MYKVIGILKMLKSNIIKIIFFRRALIDQYLDWHHTNLRVGAGHQIYQRVFGPMIGLKTNQEEIKKKEKILKNSLKHINNLLSKTKRYLKNFNL